MPKRLAMEEPSFIQRLMTFFGFGAAPAPPPAPPPPSEAESIGKSSFDFEDSRIPQSARTRIVAIMSLLSGLEPQARERRLIPELTELQRIHNAYLPRLLQSYVDIPREHRGEVFRETGRSAVYLLNERLDKMIARLHEISGSLARGNLDAFDENMRFIDLRFGSSDSPFD